FYDYSNELKQITDYYCMSEKLFIYGLSLGGMILQHYAAKYHGAYKAIILCDAAITLTFTKWDKIMLFFFPKWLLLIILKFTKKKLFTKLSFVLGRLTRWN